jgi:hypothetical protein
MRPADLLCAFHCCLCPPCAVPAGGKGPEPWTFTTFRTLVGLLNFFVWLLLLAVVGVLMAMLVWYGASGE